MNTQLTIDPKTESKRFNFPALIRLDGVAIGYVIRGGGADGLRSGDRFYVCVGDLEELIADSPLTDDLGVTAVYQAATTVSN